MKSITVGMGDMNVTNDVDACLVTYALGSCIAIIVYDPLRHAAGMIHYMLPASTIAPEKAKERPAMFADTGIPMLFEKMYALGCTKRDMVVKIVGGASVCDENHTFEIGKRNHLIARKMFWKVGVVIAAEDVGGSLSRTARVQAATGRVIIRIDGEEVEL